ncbi:MAG: CRISPR-associated helicase Cas3', partial [Candidatus Hydrothermae bacterium]|nr:CRISPR-associated helicase Cas3' [Candidatus Hydrothermae bacterium]
ESEVVVTTFVQVFHTLFGYENRFLKKLHNLVGSVLILDEPQQFPVEYWKALGWMVALLQEEMGVSVVLMTATQPRILEEVPHQDLVPPTVQKELRRALNRYQVKDLPGEEAFRNVLEDVLAAEKRVLVVVNTIRTSLELWRALHDLGVESSYLSTNILPLHRKKRVQWLQRRLKEPGPLLVVSTQVVEAGVDLDFDVVFRELSPLDALIQSAGRCNREGRKEKGEVYRFTFEGSLLRGSRIYGRVAMEVAREVWKGEKVLDEGELNDLLEGYYTRLLERGTQMVSQRMWFHYARLSFSDPRGFLETLKDYPLITYRAEVPILVMLSREDEEVLERFRGEVLEEREDWNLRQEAYLRYRVWLHEHTLRVLTERVRKNLPPEWEGTGFRWIPYDQLATYYDLETGFRWLEEDLEEEVWVL